MHQQLSLGPGVRRAMPPEDACLGNTTLHQAWPDSDLRLCNGSSPCCYSSPYFFGSCVGDGTSQLKMCATGFHFPSACFFHTSTSLPWSSWDLPWGFFAVIW